MGVARTSSLVARTSVSLLPQPIFSPSLNVIRFVTVGLAALAFFTLAPWLLNSANRSMPTLMSSSSSSE